MYIQPSESSPATREPTGYATCPEFYKLNIGFLSWAIQTHWTQQCLGLGKLLHRSEGTKTKMGESPIPLSLVKYMQLLFPKLYIYLCVFVTFSIWTRIHSLFSKDLQFAFHPQFAVSLQKPMFASVVGTANSPQSAPSALRLGFTSCWNQWRSVVYMIHQFTAGNHSFLLMGKSQIQWIQFCDKHSFLHFPVQTVTAWAFSAVLSSVRLSVLKVSIKFFAPTYEHSSYLVCFNWLTFLWLC